MEGSGGFCGEHLTKQHSHKGTKNFKQNENTKFDLLWKDFVQEQERDKKREKEKMKQKLCACGKMENGKSNLRNFHQKKKWKTKN